MAPGAGAAGAAGAGAGRGAAAGAGAGASRRAGVALDDHVVELGLEAAEAGAVGALERDELVAEVEHRAGVGRRVGRDVGVDLLERARLAHRGVERAGRRGGAGSCPRGRPRPWPCTGSGQARRGSQATCRRAPRARGSRWVRWRTRSLILSPLGRQPQARGQSTTHSPTVSLAIGWSSGKGRWLPCASWLANAAVWSWSHQGQRWKPWQWRARQAAG